MHNNLANNQYISLLSRLICHTVHGEKSWKDEPSAFAGLTAGLGVGDRMLRNLCSRIRSRARESGSELPSGLFHRRESGVFTVDFRPSLYIGVPPGDLMQTMNTWPHTKYGQVTGLKELLKMFCRFNDF